jgi:hypothetical protein
MKKITFISIGLLGLLISSNCLIDDYLKNKQIAVDLPSYNVHVVLEFVDVNTGKYVSSAAGEQVSGQFSQVGTGVLLNYLDQPVTNFTAMNGVFACALDPDQNPTPENPVIFLLNANLNGFEPVSKWVRLTGNGVHSFRVAMYQTANPPDGVEVIADSDAGSTDSSGKVLSAVSIPMGQKAAISIPVGTILKDASGNPLSGKVSFRGIYYDPDQTSALQVFPGGLDVRTNRSGAIEDGTFLTSGLFDLTVMVGGKEVKTLENGGINIRNQVAREAGTSIDLWTLDETKGVWVYEQTSQVKVVENQTVLEATITHLSVINWDIYLGNCSSGISLKFVPGSENLAEMNISINLHLNVPEGTNYSQQKSFQFNPQLPDYPNTIQLNAQVPQLPGTFSFSSTTSTTATFSPPTWYVSNLCGPETYEIVVNQEPEVPPHLPLSFDILVDCPNNDEIAYRPSFLLWYKPEGASRWFYQPMVKGKITLYLNPGIWYDAAALFSNDIYRTSRFMIENQGDEVWVHHVEYFMAETAGSYEFMITKFHKTDDVYLLSPVIELSQESCDVLGVGK